MSIAGTTNVGGRSVSEIADRFLEQSTLKGGALPRDALSMIKRFLAIAGDPDDAVAQLRALAADAKLDISAAIDQFESRVGFMAARGIDTGATRFSTSFGRGLDYYTGFEFELHAKGNGVEPLVAGGRYDGLMTQLGAPAPIPAVGFSIWVEALTQAGPQARRKRPERERIMTAPFVLAVPSKGRLQENAEAFFTPRRTCAGKAARRPRLSRHHHRARQCRDRLSLGERDRLAAGARHGASRRHRRRPGARKHRRCRQARPADRQSRLWQRQCRGRRAAGLDRRPHHGRSRRCHHRLPRAA